MIQSNTPVSIWDLWPSTTSANRDGYIVGSSARVLACRCCEIRWTMIENTFSSSSRDFNHLPMWTDCGLSCNTTNWIIALSADTRYRNVSISLRLFSWCRLFSCFLLNFHISYIRLVVIIVCGCSKVSRYRFLGIVVWGTFHLPSQHSNFSILEYQRNVFVNHLSHRRPWRSRTQFNGRRIHFAPQASSGCIFISSEICCGLHASGLKSSPWTTTIETCQKRLELSSVMGLCRKWCLCCVLSATFVYFSLVDIRVVCWDKREIAISFW